MSSYAGAPSGSRGQPPHRSLGGPIILILIGVLLLLGNLHWIAWDSLGHYFARWWPLLVILWGVVRLLEHFASRQAGRRVSAFGAGSVLLLIALVFFGLMASGIDRFGRNLNWGNLDSGDYGALGNFWGDSYSFNQEVVQEFPAGGELRVISEHGSVNLAAWDQNQLKVVVAKRLRAHSESEANQLDSSTRVQVTRNGSEVLINANTLGGGERSVESDLTIYLPRRASANLATRDGDVTVTQRTGDVQVSDAHGDVNLNEVAGDSAVALRGGSLRAAKLDGNVNVTGRVDDLYLTDIQGTVNINGDVMENLTLARVAKAVSYHSSRTDLEFAALPGQLTLESDELKANQITGPLRLATRSKAIHLEDVSGDVHLENSNGEVELKASRLPLGALHLSNRNADIRVILPAQAAFRLNVNVRRGDIQSDFHGTDIFTERGDSHGSGTVGSGGPQLDITNEHGDVQIRKS
jgi:DUF4097 and DUF4098 domain-containing protein YvlB